MILDGLIVELVKLGIGIGIGFKFYPLWQDYKVKKKSKEVKFWFEALSK